MTPEQVRASIIPKSDQLNADDVVSGPMTVTVRSVTQGSPDQPVNIAIEEDARAYRPCKTMRRLLVHCWGIDAREWKGRKMTLVHDPKVMFGGVLVGGIRISHLSHIEEPVNVMLSEKRGKKAPVSVRPLTDSPSTEGDGAGRARGPQESGDVSPHTRDAGGAPTPAGGEASAPPAGPPSLNVDEARALCESESAPPWAGVALKMADQGGYERWFRNDGTSAEARKWMHDHRVHEALKAISEAALLNAG